MYHVLYHSFKVKLLNFIDYSINNTVAPRNTSNLYNYISLFKKVGTCLYETFRNLTLPYTIQTLSKV